MFDSSIDLLLPHISLWLSLVLMFAARGAPQDVFRMGVDFEGIRFEKLVFFDNTTLLEDVTFVDRMVAEAKRREPSITRPDPTLPPADFAEQRRKEELVVELLLIGDYSMFEKFKEFYPQSHETANIALRDYLTAMQSMYDRFVFFNQTRLILRLVDVMPIIREEDCPILNHPTAQFNETFDVEEAFTSSNETGELTSEDGGIGAFDALKAIHSWLEEKMPLLPPHDHSVVITRRDLLSQRNESSTQGMAYVRAMCRGPDSTSVVEDVGGFATAVIAAHELAHNLGAFHDGSGNSSECAGRANFLMSPTTSGNEQSERFGNSVLLSDCSVRQIEEFLESPDSDCLRWPKRSEEPKIPRWTPERQPPGVVFDRTQQCRVAFGPNYGVCTQRNPAFKRKTNDVCRRLWCKNRAEHRFNSCETRAYLPLMDGTPCGDRKHCMSGTCVQDEGAARLNETCIDVRVDYCRKFASPINRRMCAVRNVRETCCRTCGGHSPPPSSVDRDPSDVGGVKPKSKRIKSDL